MDAFHILNKDEEKYKLILVCREKEYKEFFKEREIPEWLELHHASGDELVPLYAKADLGLLALEKNAYSRFQIAIKLYQYVSFGLPVVSTNVEAMTQIINENSFGTVAE